MSGPILIVDDEASVTMTLEWFFKERGHEVYRAFYGDQALELIRKHKPAVVVLDLQMPGVDGVAVLSELKKSCPDTRVLVITAHERQYEQDLQKLKPDVVRPKPVSLDELTSTVEEFLEGKEARPRESGKPRSAEKIRLLFIEGTPDLFQRYIQPFFEEASRRTQYEVRVASSQEAALGILKEFKPHLVLLDNTRMPVGTDAGQLASHLGQSPDKPLEVILHAFPSPSQMDDQFSAERLPLLEEAIRRVAERHRLVPREV